MCSPGSCFHGTVWNMVEMYLLSQVIIPQHFKSALWDLVNSMSAYKC